MVGRMQKFSALNHLHPKEIIPQNLSSSSVSTVSEELRNKQTQTHLYLIVYKKDYHYKDIVRVLKWQTCMPYNFLPRICKLLYLDWLYDPKESSFYISLKKIFPYSLNNFWIAGRHGNYIISLEIVKHVVLGIIDGKLHDRCLTSKVVHPSFG